MKPSSTHTGLMQLGLWEHLLLRNKVKHVPEDVVCAFGCISTAQGQGQQLKPGNFIKSAERRKHSYKEILGIQGEAFKHQGSP